MFLYLLLFLPLLLLLQSASLSLAFSTTTTTTRRRRSITRKRKITTIRTNNINYNNNGIVGDNHISNLFKNNVWFGAAGGGGGASSFSSSSSLSLSFSSSWSSSSYSSSSQPFSSLCSFSSSCLSMVSMEKKNREEVIQTGTTTTEEEEEEKNQQNNENVNNKSNNENTNENENETESNENIEIETNENDNNMENKPGTAKMDVPWSELGFQFRPTKSHLRMIYKNGKWGEAELIKDPYIKIHMGATALHYGQSCFEGLKAFAHEDGSVHVFRPDENAKRLQSSCERIMMPYITQDQFLNAVKTIVRDNISYVPPYGSNGALYLRPLLFGSGPRIGLQPSDEYTFLLMVIPVGDYYKGGLVQGVDGKVCIDYDRAAPRGVGNVKVAGNYAADLLPNLLSKNEGYPISLYLDAKTQSYIEEFSTSNFVGINYEQKLYVTPKSSNSVLPSITNLSLMTLMKKDLKWNVEQRDIKVEEMVNFNEVFACGTAVVVTPISSITHGDQVYQFAASSSASASNNDGDGNGNSVGKITKWLYDQVRAIQNGEIEDIHGWNMKVF